MKSGLLRVIGIPIFRFIHIFFRFYDRDNILGLFMYPAPMGDYLVPNNDLSTDIRNKKTQVIHLLFKEETSTSLRFNLAQDNVSRHMKEIIYKTQEIKNLQEKIEKFQQELLVTASNKEKCILDLILMTDGPIGRQISLADLSNPNLNVDQRQDLSKYINR